MQDIINGRCGWCGTDELYVKYHMEQWLYRIEQLWRRIYRQKDIMLFE